MSGKELLKGLVRKVWATRLYRAALIGGDLLTARMASGRTTDERDARDEFTLLVPPPTGENLGDLAMFQSILANTPGRIRVVPRHSHLYEIPEVLKDRVSVTPLPKLIHGFPGFRVRDVARFARLAKDAKRVLVPGADTLDGGHLHNSLARLSAATVAAASGTPTRVLGFSWASGAPIAAEDALRRLGEYPTVELFARDPRSYSRLRAVRISNLVSASDLVFSLPRPESVSLYAELETFLSALESTGDKYVVFNASGLIARRMDLLEDYGKVIDLIHSAGLRIVFLPHVHRPYDDDVAETGRIYRRYGRAGDFFVDRLLDPVQVSRVTGGGQFSVTGRMHCAILTLTTGRPSMTLATAGKVEGLYEMFDLDDMVVQPRPGNGTELARVARLLIDDTATYAEKVRSALPSVRESSRANFDSATRIDSAT